MVEMLRPAKLDGTVYLSGVGETSFTVSIVMQNYFTR